MNDLLGAILRSLPACICGEPGMFVLGRSGVRCSVCFVSEHNSISSVGLLADGYASVAPIPAPGSTVRAADATLSIPTVSSHSPGSSENCGVASVSPLFSSVDPELDALIDDLIADWARHGIVTNAETLRTFAMNEIAPIFSVSPSDISNPVIAST